MQFLIVVILGISKSLLFMLLFLIMPFEGLAEEGCRAGAGVSDFGIHGNQVGRAIGLY